MITFKKLKQLAEKRKGGPDKLQSLLSPIENPKKWSKKPASFFLAQMTKGVFQAGFSWKVIENKWDGFEAVFLDFDEKALIDLPDEVWDSFCEDTRIVRNPRKIQTVRNNALFIQNVEEEYGKPFGKILEEWPASNQIELMALLKKRGSHLGGMTGQYFLRRIGKDGFLLSQDVVRSLQDMGLDIKDNPTSKGDHKRIQDAFNQLNQETGLPITHISRILGFATGQNFEVSRIQTEHENFSET